MLISTMAVLACFATRSTQRLHFPTSTLAFICFCATARMTGVSRHLSAVLAYISLMSQPLVCAVMVSVG